MTDEGSWVSLFSGGKDSSWALYRALERGLDVSRLVTVHPEGDSYMYHVPATHLATLAAESIGIGLVDVDPADFDAEHATDSGVQGDAELEPLERALEALDEGLPGGIAGVTAGAVESEYQTSRIEAMCERLGCDLFAPLWQEDPRSLGEGGEFETFVVDGPHMDRRVELAYDVVWEGTRGHIDVTDATLA